MRLTRRDALAALAAGGAASAAGCETLRWGEAGDGEADDRRAGDGEGGFTLDEREALIAVARTVFPSEVSGVERFVERYSVGRLLDRPAYRDGVAEAVGTLDEYARSWYDVRFVDLAPADRDALLREMAVDAADPAPDGDEVERVRHYLVNELLYALYTTPTGGKLVGIENPQGYPGGTRSYRRPLGEADGGTAESTGAEDQSDATDSPDPTDSAGGDRG
jgi:hypothetical protein